MEIFFTNFKFAKLHFMKKFLPSLLGLDTPKEFQRNIFLKDGLSYLG